MHPTLTRVLGFLAAFGMVANVLAQAPRVVLVAGASKESGKPFMERLRRGMAENGQKEGITFQLEVLYADRDTTRVPRLIHEAVESRPAVIVVGGLLAAQQARDATRTIPIVVATSSDLVDAGVVKSYSRPGGNITGLNDLADELAVKRIELLHEALPKASRVALLLNPQFPATTKIERRIRGAADALSVSVTRLDAADAPSLLRALDSLEKSPPDALLAGGDSLQVQMAPEIIQRMSSMRVPVIHFWPGTAEAGALISHQADVLHNYQRAAYYVNRILKGAKPGDLPIEQPTRYELVVNKKTASALNLAIPRSILLRADRVIE